MQKINFWVPIQKPKWNTPVHPSIYLLQARVNLRPTGLTIEGQLVAVPENVANINAMYLKARPILLVYLTCSSPGVRYRCLTECNSRVDN